MVLKDNASANRSGVAALHAHKKQSFYYAAKSPIHSSRGAATQVEEISTFGVLGG
jgi:hypothetical protein